MSNSNVSIDEVVSSANQEIFDILGKTFGLIPSLYATMSYSEEALGNYLQLQQGNTSFNNKEKEAINLAVCQANHYLSAHSTLGKKDGFADDRILDNCSESALFDQKLDALVRLTVAILNTKGTPSILILNQFFPVDFSKGSLIDLIVAPADKIGMDNLNTATHIPINYLEAQSFEKVKR